MAEKLPREIPFDSILNFRDLGGYPARDGRTVAWRRLFRSGEMHLATARDLAFLRDEIGLKTVIDLRSSHRLERTGAGRLGGIGIKHYHIPLNIVTAADDNTMNIGAVHDFSSMGEVYLFRVRRKDYVRRVVKALELIAAPDNHPVVFHCNAGKDRSGVLAAIVLSLLGVADADIAADYVLTAVHMRAFIERWDKNPETADVHKSLPAYQLETRPESITLFLAEIKREYGSVGSYLEAYGADPSLAERLARALLV